MLASMVCRSKIFFITIRRLVLVSPTSIYYKILSDPLTALKLLKTDEDLCLFVKDCYENSFKIDLFTDHSGYDIIEMIAEELHPKKPVSHVDSDSDVETNHPLDYIVMSLSNLNMKIRTENPNPNLQGIFLLEVEDPNDEQVESKFKAKNNVSYPSFNPDTPLNECKPVLGMRVKSPQQLKHMLVNYGKKSKTVDNEECESSKRDSKKGDGRKALNEIIRKVVKEIWDKKKEYEKKWSLNKLFVPLGCRPHG
ncbi:hypothetical protein Tco_0250925 [Tanacetum coccineum]